MKKITTYLTLTALLVFSALLIQNHTNESLLNAFTLENAKVTAKDILRPIAQQVGLAKTPPPTSKREDFIDRDRIFVKTVNRDGTITMVEQAESPLPGLFDDKNSFLVAGDLDVIVELFNGYKTERKIIYNRSDIDFPLNLLRTLSAVVKHGSLDDSMGFQQSFETLRSRQLSMTCGYVTNFAVEVLSGLGISSRVISTLNLGEWNSYDNGHTLLEVFLPGRKKWMAVDLDMKKSFVTPHTDKASLLDISDAGINNVNFLDLSSGPSIDYSGSKNYQTLSEFSVLNIRDWYKRVFQAFAVYDEGSGKYVFLADDDKAIKKIKSYSESYTTLPRDEFVERFYSTDP